MIEKDAKMERSVVDIPIYGYLLSIKTSSKVSPQVKFWSFYLAVDYEKARQYFHTISLVSHQTTNLLVSAHGYDSQGLR